MQRYGYYYCWRICPAKYMVWDGVMLHQGKSRWHRCIGLYKPCINLPDFRTVSHVLWPWCKWLPFLENIQTLKKRSCFCLLHDLPLMTPESEEQTLIRNIELGPLGSGGFFRRGVQTSRNRKRPSGLRIILIWSGMYLFCNLIYITYLILYIVLLCFTWYDMFLLNLL